MPGNLNSSNNLAHRNSSEMEYFISHYEKLLSTTISFELKSLPNFSVEVLLAAAICLIHIIILLELNLYAKKSNSSIVDDLRAKRLIIGSNTTFPFTNIMNLDFPYRREEIAIVIQENRFKKRPQHIDSLPEFIL